MPIYDYLCKDCGSFTALRKMSESDEAAACPGCGIPGERRITAPQLAILGKAQRSAYERNEKSAHEPKMVRRSSCGCNGTHTCAKSDATSSSSMQKPASTGSAYVMQTKKTARPWMLGH